MRESRLFKIIYYLLDKGSATAAELAEQFEVSIRTIYRDMDALSLAGVPIYGETGRNGGIRLLGDFVLDRALLSEEEKQEILSALQGLEIVESEYGRDTKEKLSALFKTRSARWLEVDFSRWGEKTRDKDKFQILKSAILCNKSMKIHYAGSCGEVTDRVIYPLKLSYKSKDWYVKAYCTMRQGFRLFKLNRILKWEILEEEFEPMTFPEEVDVSGPKHDKITLRFPGNMGYRIYDEFDVKQIQTEETGSLIVTASMPKDDWLVGYLLSFGGQVEILEPLDLKKAVLEKAKEICEKYKM